MNVLVCSRIEEHSFEDVSFFHPKGFEYAITVFLNAMFGVARPQLKYKYGGPIDWKAMPSIFSLAVSFKIKPDNTFLCFPVSKKHFVLFEFRNSIVHEELHGDADRLIESIIESVKIELGKNTRTLIEEQKKSCPDWRITDDFPPLSWPIKPEEVEGVSTSSVDELEQVKN